MFLKFLSNLRASIAFRKQIVIPGFRKQILFLMLGTVVYLAIAVLIAPENQPERYFVQEGGMVTYISAFMLAVASYLAGVSFNLSRSRTELWKYFWLLATLGFAFLFLDELLRFHEFTGRWISKSTEVPEGFRRWDDIIVILYGFGAVIFMGSFLPEVFRFPKVAEMMAVAFLFYFLHTFIDSTFEPRTTMSAILEESAKVYCAEFLAISMYIAKLGIQTSSGMMKGK